MAAVTIERIETAGPDRRARRLVLSDGLEPRLTSATVVKELSLAEGGELDPEAFEESLRVAEPRHARDRALQLLGYRERSCSEVRKRLVDDGYPREIADAVVQRYSDLELIDDARFAALWTRSRALAGYGRRRIANELTQRGVDPDTAQSALDDVLGDNELQRARNALRGKSASDRAGRDKLVRKLVARGFDLRTAITAVGSPDVADDNDEPFVGR